MRALYKTVTGVAAAATKETRFEPVRPEDLSSMDVEISALNPSRQVSLEDIQVGVHGLMVNL